MGSREPMVDKDINQTIADRLREAAALLEKQQANPFRLRAYRNAAETIVSMDENLSDLFARAGPEGLEALPGIGRSLAAAIAEMLHTGRWAQLERLRGTAEPEKLFCSIPGVGPALAHRLHAALHVDTLEALEVAAHDGRLELVPGVGPRRAAGLRAALGAMLRRTRSIVRQAGEEPGVDVLLDVDAEYRAKARADSLSKIAPRRFNPRGEAWLPVLHTERGPWQFTVLFSNTARAHELGRIADWVVVYFHTDTRPEGQRTIVTERQGELAGRRVVRGREIDCRRHYLSAPLAKGASRPTPARPG
jgi:DNA polymerase (family 10)